MSTQDGEGDQLLAPHGFIDNTLTVVVGIVGGFIVGIIGTFALGILTASAWGVLLGLLVWLGATAYLVRRRTVQDAIAKSGYAVAVFLLLVPLIALSPTASGDAGLAARGGAFLTLLLFVALPAGIAATVGWMAAQYVPEDHSGSEG